MAKRIAKFEKVSFEQFKGGYTDAIGEASDEQIREVYDSLKLPKRATKGSAGYDFYAPAAITLKPGETAKIPTGIRAKMEDNWVLQCYPRSGLGFKFRLQLNNTVGIIDSDFSTLFNNITVRHLKLSPNVIYYLIDENRIVIAAMLHSKQSPETVRKTISEFLKQYK